MRHSILLVAVCVSAVTFWALPALAQYVALSKLPKSYLDRTQQVRFHGELVKEMPTYPKHPNERVRGWYGEMVGLNGQGQPQRLDMIYRTAHGLVRYQAEARDFWHTPAQTITKGHGDCDDYANLYLVSASLAGFGLEHLWLVAGYHYGRRGRIGHAVAIVSLDNGEARVLDNLYGRVIPDEQHKAFKPVYAINWEAQMAFMAVNSKFAGGF